VLDPAVPERQPLTTGIGSLDSGIGGGFFPGEITELVGPPGSAKTLIAMQTALNTAAAGESTLYIDTCNSFSLARLCSVCEECGLRKNGKMIEESKGLLSKIKV